MKSNKLILVGCLVLSGCNISTPVSIPGVELGKELCSNHGGLVGIKGHEFVRSTDYPLDSHPMIYCNDGLELDPTATK